MSTWEERMAERAAARTVEPSVLPPRYRNREEAQADCDAYCPECSEVYLDGPIEGPLVWSTRLTCQFKCGHEHHSTELWLAAAAAAWVVLAPTTTGRRSTP